MARLTIVNYAVNGVGAGQVQRLVAINRWLLRYGALQGDAVEPYFLTSTEAENILFAERMAAFRIPSMAAAHAAQLERHRYLALAKQWIWHSLGLLQPHILIVDTWPRGAFGELLNAIDLCRKRIFIFGAEAGEHADAPDFQAMLPLYDLILVPEHEGTLTLPFGKTDPARIKWIGPILSREGVELAERWEARERLGVPPDRFVLYISTGSGGDADAREVLLSICTAVLDVPDVHLVIGGGPLYFGSVLQGPRITWLNGPSAELMAGFDAAICAAGYSAFNELQFARVPTAWIPLDKAGDNQGARVGRATAGGTLVLDVKDLRGSTILAVLERLREPAFRRHAAEQASALVPANCARQAAQAVLSTVYEPGDVARAAAAVDDAVLRAAAGISLPVHAVLTFARWISGETRPGPAATAAACALTDALFLHALHPPLGAKIIEPLCRILPTDEPARRVQAIVSLLDAFACFEDWNETQTFLQVLVPETVQSLERFQAELEALLQAAGEQGMSLQDVADALTAARASTHGHSQHEAIGEITRRLSESQRPRRRDAS